MHLDIVQEQTVRQTDEEASFQLNVTRKPEEKVPFVKSTCDGKVVTNMLNGSSL